MTTSPNTSGGGEQFTLPEDLSVQTTDELNELLAQATTYFNTLYGDGTELSNEDVENLAVLTEMLERLQAEVIVREEAAAERKARADELAARVGILQGETTVPEDESVEIDTEEEPVTEEPVEIDAEEEPEADGAGETVTAAADLRVNLSRVRSRASRHPKAMATDKPASNIRDVMHVSGEGVAQYVGGQGVDWAEAADIVSKRLAKYKAASFDSARRSGSRLRQQFPIVTLLKPFSPDLTIQNNDPAHVMSVIQHAINEKRLPKGSLVASGGWCSPSEVLYDLVEMESRDGIFSLPQVNAARGGISRTLGPAFSELYASVGFHYTEAQDIAGTYDTDPVTGEGTGDAGSKPCIEIDCPDFEEFRLDLDGLCIKAGILAQRGFPELIARTLRGVLVAHDHRMAGRRLAAIAQGSTGVVFPGPLPGATAAALSAVELQIEHLRYTQRLSRGATIEVIVPFWVRGAFRADLAKRLGVDLVDVSNARIDSFFAQRGASVQYVYNWDDIQATAAGDFLKWPDTFRALVYPAGTWVDLSSDVITLDTIYDSALLGNNDYTALFTEEGSKVVKMGHDSRVLTIPVCADGATAAGVDFECGDLGTVSGVTTTTTPAVTTTTTSQA